MIPATGQAIVLQANALHLPLPDNTVDLVVTSPPYFALRSYRDGDEHYDGQIGSETTPHDFLEALWAATAEMKRVLKPTGSIWVNLGDKYAGSGGHNNSGVGGSGRGPSRYNQASTVPAKSLMGLPWRYAIGCIDRLGLILRAEVIWSKPNGLPESVTDRVRRSHEQWFHFTKQGRYFAAVDEVREPQAQPERSTGKSEGQGRKVNEYETTALSFATHRDGTYARQYNPLGKLPGSVWTIPSEPLIIPDAVKAHYNLPDHFAAFPQEWPRRIILGWSPSGICTACGEGRRPVVEKDAKPNPEPRPGDGYHHRSGGDGTQSREAGTATITGYTCACSEPSVPTRPSVILDPFGGTGTVALVARALGRAGVTVDLSHDYCRLARWRIFESGHERKTLERTFGKTKTTRRKKKPVGVAWEQPSLLDAPAVVDGGSL